MKQKIVVKVSMHGNSSRSKALQIAASLSGVESAAITGERKDQVEVVGEGTDAVELTRLLRKKVGHAELVSVSEAKKEAPRPEAVNPQPLAMAGWYPAAPPPPCDCRPGRCHDPSCNIM